MLGDLGVNRRGRGLLGDLGVNMPLGCSCALGCGPRGGLLVEVHAQCSQCVGLLWFGSSWGSRVWWQPAAGTALMVTSSAEALATRPRPAPCLLCVCACQHT